MRVATRLQVFEETILLNSNSMTTFAILHTTYKQHYLPIPLAGFQSLGLGVKKKVIAVSLGCDR